MPPARRRRLLLKLSLLAGGLVAGLMLAEGALRIAVPGSRIDLFRYSAETQRYKTMTRNCDGIVYGVPLRTNALGFRDAKNGPVAPKQPGEFRVVVLGDSFTVCAGVPFDALATTRLEAMLRERSVRVLNLGTAGYSLIEYALVLDEVATALQPDAVILANYVTNDFQTKTWLNNREIALGRIKPARANWRESLLVWRVCGPPLESLLWRVESKPAPVRPAFGEGSDGWSENSGALLRIAARTRELRIALRVCLLPHPSNFAKQTARHDIVAKLCREHDIAVTDALSRFIATGKSPRDFRLNLVDSHPNAAYNDIVAHAMFDALTANGFPPAP